MGICGPGRTMEDQRSEGMEFDSQPSSRPGALGKFFESHTLPICVIVRINCVTVYIQTGEGR